MLTRCAPADETEHCFLSDVLTVCEISAPRPRGYVCITLRPERTDKGDLGKLATPTTLAATALPLLIAIGPVPLELFSTPAGHRRTMGPSIDLMNLNVACAACIRRNRAGMPGLSGDGKAETEIAVNSDERASKWN